jgi:hypothetical protein
LFVFLELECYGNGVGEGQERVVKLKGAVISDELEVAEAETFGPALSCYGEILTGAHCEEKGAPSELVGCSVELAIVVTAEFAEDARSEGLLWASRGVAVFVALQLIR